MIHFLALEVSLSYNLKNFYFAIMKNAQLLFLFILLLGSSSVTAQSDAIIGQWRTASKESIIKIYREGDTYFGKISWTENPNLENGDPKRDPLNPDVSKQQTLLMDVFILKDFKFNGKDTWEGGEIYDPTHGKTYSANISMKDENTLKLRGYIGTPLIGKTVTWIRESPPR